MCNWLGDKWWDFQHALEIINFTFIFPRRFAERLGYSTTREYSPWLFNGQIAGYVKVFARFAYSTIRGSGHMVPTDKPGAAQKMFYKFIDSN